MTTLFPETSSPALKLVTTDGGLGLHCVLDGITSDEARGKRWWWTVEATGRKKFKDFNNQRQTTFWLAKPGTYKVTLKVTGKVQGQTTTLEFAKEIDTCP